VIKLPNEIVFVGHASIDRIRNIHGEKVQPGGAALYSAIGAKTVCKDVGILTAVGEDYPFSDIFAEFPYAKVKKIKGKSTRFFISYGKDWNANYRKVSIGPGSQITTRDVENAVKNGAKMIHLAPMNPPKVENMVKKIKKENRDVTVSINSVIHYMDERANRHSIMNAAALSDIFILNEKELHAVTGSEVVSEAIQRIKTKMLVLTLGEIGTVVSYQGSTEFIPAMAAITKSPLDVTGAGDVWAGAFLGSYFKTGSWIKAVSFASVVSAIKCTGWNFEKVRPLKFENVGEVYNLAIAIKEKGRQLTLKDALKSLG
jgi:sugar/nucleoside kinase (ribokinase family)